jgi:hypothetical protein
MLYNQITTKTRSYSKREASFDEHVGQKDVTRIHGACDGGYGSLLEQRRK